jgi:quercetin dioxygenase-like cupin family protein
MVTEPPRTEGTKGAYAPSPRPTFDGPAHIPRNQITRHLWGDDQAGHVTDWIFVSNEKIHQLIFGLPGGGSFGHSEEYRTVFAADQVFYVLTGSVVFSNPETGEAHLVRQGEVAYFSHDTWHHGHNVETSELRVLEFFAPPPSQGTSGSYARTQPYLTDIVRGQDQWVGNWPGALEKASDGFSMGVVREPDVLWRLEGGVDGDRVLTGLWVSTDELTVGTTRVLPGQRSSSIVHGGDKGLYVHRGTLAINVIDGDGNRWHELNEGDGFYLPEGVPHRYQNAGSDAAEVIFGVAPRYLPVPTT